MATNGRTADHDEALRRISLARESAATELNLSGLALEGLPKELTGLTALQSLDLDLPLFRGRLTA